MKLDHRIRAKGAKYEKDTLRYYLRSARLGVETVQQIKSVNIPFSS